MKKGFTLLELLIVIGILAILSTTMILVINPAELLKKARDSQRMSDLSTVKTAIAFYLTNASSPSVGSTGQTYAEIGAVTCFGTASPTASSTYLYVNGSGYIPINFTSISIGSPLSSLPHDPNTSAASTGNHYYVYGVKSTSDLTFKLVTNMESAAYSNGGSNDIESKDGGTNTGLYERGTDLTLTITTGANCFNSVAP
jgi:prepilin-type N-terminal cleavage/methylation domain-containing protein